MVYTILIDGLECAQCEKTAREALLKIEGVCEVQLDRASKGAVVTAQESVTPQQLTEAVQGAGCTVLDVQPTEEDTCCCTGKHKARSEQERRDLANRLKRIEGQVRGVERMLENDAYCTDLLVQVSAISAALNSFNKVLLASHVRSCVADNIRAGNDEVIDELVGLLQRLMK